METRRLRCSRCHREQDAELPTRIGEEDELVRCLCGALSLFWVDSDGKPKMDGAVEVVSTRDEPVHVEGARLSATGSSRTGACNRLTTRR